MRPLPSRNPLHIKAFFNKKKGIKGSFNLITCAAVSLRMAAAPLVVSRRFVQVSDFNSSGSVASRLRNAASPRA
jgi:hypothetical protein